MAAQGAPRVAARVPALEEKAADLAPRVELVGRSARRGLLVWWCPSWSGAADEDGFAFHVVARQGALEDGGAPRWWCACPHGEHHPGDRGLPARAGGAAVDGGAAGAPGRGARSGRTYVYQGPIGAHARRRGREQHELVVRSRDAAPEVAPGCEPDGRGIEPRRRGLGAAAVAEVAHGHRGRAVGCGSRGGEGRGDGRVSAVVGTERPHGERAAAGGAGPAPAGRRPGAQRPGVPPGRQDREEHPAPGAQPRRPGAPGRRPRNRGPAAGQGR